MRAENEDLMGWLLSRVMAWARSPVKIGAPGHTTKRCEPLRDFMMLLLLPMMMMMMMIMMMH